MGDPQVVLLSSLDDALSGGPLGAEGGHKRVVLAAQHEDVRVGLVHVVVEFRELPFLHRALLTPCSLCSRYDTICADVSVTYGPKKGILTTAKSKSMRKITYL